MEINGEGFRGFAALEATRDEADRFVGSSKIARLARVVLPELLGGRGAERPNLLLVGNQLTDIKGLEGLTQLAQLNLDRNQLGLPSHLSSSMAWEEEVFDRSHKRLQNQDLLYCYPLQNQYRPPSY